MIQAQDSILLYPPWIRLFPHLAVGKVAGKYWDIDGL